MRGKLRNMGGMLWDAGLIPAHAGKTRASKAITPARGAHPRACGENLIGLGADLASMGSSPRMRGKHDEQLEFLIETRLIPAHAGKTVGRGGMTFDTEAHPRACGENGAPSLIS